MSSDLIDNIDSAYIISTVALFRTAEPAKACLLVEGPDDNIIYKRFVNQNYCEIIICYGKENLIPAIDSLNQQQVVNGYLGIKDADFDLVNAVPCKPNLFFTDGHDLEVMIFNSEAFDKFIEMRLRGENSVLIDTIKQEIRTKVFEATAVIGYLQWLSLKYKWDIKIPTFHLLDHLSPDFELSLNDCILKIKELYTDIEQTKCDYEEFMSLKVQYLMHLCNGHELITLLIKLFPGIAKKHLKKKFNPGGDVTEALFLAYEFSMFKNNALYIKIINWEQQNFPFKILLN